MEQEIKKLLGEWQRRNIQGLYCRNKEEALEDI